MEAQGERELEQRLRSILQEHFTGAITHPEDIIGRKFRFTYQGKGVIVGAITGHDPLVSLRPEQSIGSIHFENGLFLRLYTSSWPIEYLELRGEVWYAKPRETVTLRPGALVLI